MKHPLLEAAGASRRKPQPDTDESTFKRVIDCSDPEGETRPLSAVLGRGRRSPSGRGAARERPDANP